MSSHKNIGYEFVANTTGVISRLGAYVRRGETRVVALYKMDYSVDSGNRDGGGQLVGIVALNGEQITTGEGQWLYADLPEPVEVAAEDVSKHNLSRAIKHLAIS